MSSCHSNQLARDTFVSISCFGLYHLDSFTKPSTLSSLGYSDDSLQTNHNNQNDIMSFKPALKGHVYVNNLFWVVPFIDPCIEKTHSILGYIRFLANNPKKDHSNVVSLRLAHKGRVCVNDFFWTMSFRSMFVSNDMY